MPQTTNVAFKGSITSTQDGEQEHNIAAWSVISTAPITGAEESGRCIYPSNGRKRSTVVEFDRTPKWSQIRNFLCEEVLSRMEVILAKSVEQSIYWN